MTDNSGSTKRCMAGVMGLGYVGLPLALQMASAGHTVVGLDVDESKIDQLKRGQSYVADVSSIAVQEAIGSGAFIPSCDFSMLNSLDAVSICVPTPLSKSHEPDLSFIRAAVDQMVEHFHKGLLIVLESTTYPGTTEEIVAGPLIRMGYRVGTDFFVCFSPERVDPGNRIHSTKNTPKIIGGVTPECLRAGIDLYASFIDNLVPVSSTRVAETAKLLENTYRSVNIALVNEIAMMCEKMSIDVWEVIRAASTKPFGFSPFYPGPGIGGHCIPLDPVYLSWKARAYGYHARMISTATEINSSMPSHVYERVGFALNRIRRSINGASILVLGVAYKKDIGDMRESPAIEIIQSLSHAGARVVYSDPFVPSFQLDGKNYESLSVEPNVVQQADCVLLLTDHSSVDYDLIAGTARLIVDTRNTFADRAVVGDVITIGKPASTKQQNRPLALNDEGTGREQCKNGRIN